MSFLALELAKLKLVTPYECGWVGALEAATQPCRYSFSLEHIFTSSYSQKCVSHLFKSRPKSHLAPGRAPCSRSTCLSRPTGHSAHSVELESHEV